MMVKEMETEQAHLSNNSGAVGQTESPREPEGDVSSGGPAKETKRNWGWMLSGIICLNILLLGCALVSSSAYNDVNISKPDLQAFLILLLLLTSIWMIYFCVYTARQQDAVVYVDSQAGPVWLRGETTVTP